LLVEFEDIEQFFNWCLTNSIQVVHKIIKPV